MCISVVQKMHIDKLFKNLGFKKIFYGSCQKQYALKTGLNLVVAINFSITMFICKSSMVNNGVLISRFNHINQLRHDTLVGNFGVLGSRGNKKKPDNLN